MTEVWTLRVARPTNRLNEIAEMYREGLGFATIGQFVDHDGFDGIILGRRGEPYHLEFTTKRDHRVMGATSPEHLLVFYIPDAQQWSARCARVVAAGFRPVSSFNPYWDVAGRTFEDLDGYRVVLQHATWIA